MNELFPLIMRHLELAEVVKSHSEKMLQIAQNGDSDDIDEISENRQRAVNLLSSIQSRIEYQLQHIKGDQELISIVKLWHEDFSALLKVIDNNDQETLDCLEKDKLKTKREIGAVHVNQQKISAYNHSEIKR